MSTAEWGIAISALGLFVVLVTQLVKLTNTLTKLTVTMDGINEKITDINCENKKEHDELWEESREHGKAINDHETRIRLIEEKPKRRTAGGTV